MKVIKGANKLHGLMTNKCPCCGEDQSEWAYDDGRGLCVPIPMRREVSIFSTRWESYLVFHCNTCGAEWESEPYED